MSVNWMIIGSGKWFGSLFDIITTNVDLLSVRPLGTNISDIFIEKQQLSRIFV